MINLINLVIDKTAEKSVLVVEVKVLIYILIRELAINLYDDAHNSC